MMKNQPNPDFIADPTMYPKFQRNVGFTLVEVLMVILVIAVLTGLILGIAGLANSKAASSRAEAELQLLANEIEDYRLEEGLYPGQSLSWAELQGSSAYTNITKRYTKKNMIADIPDLDPWGNSYEYKIPSKTGYQLQLRSKGPDGESGSTGKDADNVVL